MPEPGMIQLALPEELLEELLRNHHLHVESVHSLDPISHRLMQRLVKRSLLAKSSNKMG